MFFSVKRLITYSLLLCCVQISPVFSLEHVTLQLKWNHQFQFAGYYAALEKGFYADEGLEVTIKDRSQVPDHIQAVINSKAEYGVSDSSLILYRLKGMPVVILGAIFQHSPLVLMTRESDGLLGPYELKDKRVMWQKGLDGAAITAMLHQVGISDDDVIHIPHNFDDDALRNGAVDAVSAYLTNQPFYYQTLGIDVHIINPTHYGIDFYGDILFTTEAEIRSNPDRAKRFLRASIKGWEYALKHKDEVIQWLQNQYGVTSSIKQLRYEAAATERMIRPDLIEIGHFDVSRFNRIADIYRDEKMVSMGLTLDGIDSGDYFYQKKSTPEWVWWILNLAIATFIVVLILGGLNRRLQVLVAQRTRELEAARQEQQKYIDIVDAHVISSSTDAYGIITQVSEAFCNISQYSQSELIGHSHNLVRHPDMPKSLYQDMWENLKAGKSWSGEIKNKAKNGNAYWVEANIEPTFNNKGEIEGYTAIRKDITDKKRIEELSVTDTLTKLYNRLRLDQKLTEEFNYTNRYQHPLSVIMFDVDLFKEVNDSYGHQVGDLVLIAIAELVLNSIRKTDFAGRWGGEEFLIICPETPTDGAIELAEALRKKIEDQTYGPVDQATCSFGVATLGYEESVEALLGRADKALYKAKEVGRNCVVSASA